MKKTPRPRLILAVILGLYLALGILFAANTPPWQAPDEPAHYNYVRYLAEQGNFPVLHMGTTRTPIWKRSRAVAFRPTSAPTPSAMSSTSRRCTMCSRLRSTA